MEFKLDKYVVLDTLLLGEVTEDKWLAENFSLRHVVKDLLEDLLLMLLVRLDVFSVRQFVHVDPARNKKAQ